MSHSREDIRARLDLRLRWEHLLDRLPLDWVKPSQRTDFEDWRFASQDQCIELHRRTEALIKITNHYIPLTSDADAVRSYADGCVQRVKSIVAEIPGLADVPALTAYANSLGIEFAGIPRALDPCWWRRKLSAVLDVRTEQAARELRAVGGLTHYISQQTKARKEQQHAANKSCIKTASAEPKGKPEKKRPLSELVESSVSNPALRRAELMVRIGGADEFSVDANHVGLFLTITLPSEYHHMRVDGSSNDKWSGKTARDGHERLLTCWQLARAQLDKERIDRYGLRVAEPHKSGTSHWHILMWCAPENKARIIEVVREKFLVQGDVDHQRIGLKVETIDRKRGGAKAYLAKYVSKNIDGHGMTHAQKNGARLVKFWASAHRIRQFQFFGLPPVGVWRELRKLSEEDAQDSPVQLKLAFDACNKSAETGKVDFHKFIRAQGGCGSRRVRPIRLVRAAKLMPNKYNESGQIVTLGLDCDWWQKITRTTIWIIRWNDNTWTRGNNCNQSIQTSPLVSQSVSQFESVGESSAARLRPP